MGPPVVNSGWNEPPRIPPQTGFSNPNFHGNPPPANNWNATSAPGSADWTRPPGYQAQQIGGYNDFNGGRNQEEPSKIAEKLRLLISKDLIDVNLLNMLQNNGMSNQAHATATLNLLNTMLTKVSHQEALEAKAKKLEYMNKKPEMDRVIAEINEVKKELQEFREQIHSILKQSTANRGKINLNIDCY